MVMTLAVPRAVVAASLQSQAKSYNDQGMKLFQGNKFKEAALMFNIAVELAPENSQYHFNLDHVNYKGLENYTVALKHLDRAIQLKPSFTEAYAARSWVKQRLGDYKGSLADYDKTIASTLRDLVIGSDSNDSEANRDEVEEDSNPTRTVRIRNNGRQAIREVYIANHQDSKWGKDLLRAASVLSDDPGIQPDGTADFTLTKSSYRVYMSGYSPSSGVYRENVTGTATFNLKGCQFDIRVVFKDRKASEKLNVNICERDSFEFSD
jgi:tetratricopeptide (TPR) repeat protein